MNATSFLNFAIAGVLGILLHLLLVKIPSLKEKARVGNLTFSLTDYLRDDWMALCANFLTLGAFIFLYDELVGYKPIVAQYAKFFFLFVGFSGSSVVLALLSFTNKKIMAAIDIKTNLADGVVPPVNAQNVEGVQELQEKDEANVIPMNNKPTA